MIRIKRIYVKPEPTDGVRILVDRLWPRGIRKSDARMDEWRRDIAPSDGLRRWFHGKSSGWEEFIGRYREELAAEGKTKDLRALCSRSKRETLTLLFAARNVGRNNAVALKILIEQADDRAARRAHGDIRRRRAIS